MKIKTRDKPIQSTGGINFVAPKTPKTFAEKVKEWLKRKPKEEAKLDWDSLD